MYDLIKKLADETVKESGKDAKLVAILTTIVLAYATVACAYMGVHTFATALIVEIVSNAIITMFLASCTCFSMSAAAEVFRSMNSDSKDVANKEEP